MKETTYNTYNEVIDSKYAIVKFYTKTCSPCKKIQPLLEMLEQKYTNINFYTVDGEKEHQLVDYLNVTTVPILFLYKNGKIISDVTGSRSVSVYEDEINNLLGVN